MGDFKGTSTENFVLGDLNLRTSEHLAPLNGSEAYLRICENLVSVGIPRQPQYAPSPSPKKAWQCASEINSMYYYVRSIYGDLTDRSVVSDLIRGFDARKERVINLTENGFELSLKDDAAPSFPIFDFSNSAFHKASLTRKGQFAQIGNRVFATTSDHKVFKYADASLSQYTSENADGSAITTPATLPINLPYNVIGAPERIFEIEDDKVLGFDPPPLPYVGYEQQESMSGYSNMLGYGLYAYRVAWEYHDGTLSHASRPIWFFTKGIDDPIKFKIIEPLPFLPKGWESKIRGVAILLTQNLLWDIGSKDDNGMYVLVKDNLINDVDWGLFFTDLKNISTLLQKLASEPYFHVQSIRLKDNQNATSYDTVFEEGDGINFDELNERILNYPYYKDSQLTTHGIHAGSCIAYNEQIAFGDTAYDFVKPNLEENLDARFVLNIFSPSTIDAPMALRYVYDYKTNPQPDTLYIRASVRIKTDGGTFYRFSDVIPLPKSEIGDTGVMGYLMQFKQYVFTYPDMNAQDVSFWYFDGTNWVKKYTYTFKLPLNKDSSNREAALFTNNFAYCDFTDFIGTDGILMIDFALPTDEVITEAEIQNHHLRIDYKPNRILVSDVYQPRSLRADYVRYVGSNASDQVVGMTVNLNPVSEGQFGSFPINVLCRYSCSLIEVSSNASTSDLLGTSRFTTQDRGCIGRLAFYAIQGATFFASHDGIWTLSPDLDEHPISLPISEQVNPYSISKRLNANTAIGIYRDSVMGRQEVWIATRPKDEESSGEYDDYLSIVDDAESIEGFESLVYVFSYEHKRWSWLTRRRKCFVEFASRIWGAESVDSNYENDYNSTLTMRFQLQTVPYGSGDDSQRKRMKGMQIRQQLNRGSILYFSVFDLGENHRAVQIGCGVVDPNGLWSGASYSGSTPIFVGGCNVLQGRDGFALRANYEMLTLYIVGEGSHKDRLEGFGITLADVRNRIHHRERPTNITDVFTQANCQTGYDPDLVLPLQAYIQNLTKRY